MLRVTKPALPLWQSQIVFQLITRATNPETMDTLPRQCWQHMRSEVKASFVTSCNQLEDALEQVSSSHSSNPLADHNPAFAAATPHHLCLRQMLADAKTAKSADPQQDANEQYLGQVLACELVVNRDFEYGHVKLVRHAAAAPPASASLEPPHRRRHLVVLTR